MVREAYSQGIVITAKPADLQVLDLGVIVQVLESHELDYRFMSRPVMNRGIMANGATHPARKAYKVLPVG